MLHWRTNWKWTNQDYVVRFGLSYCLGSWDRYCKGEVLLPQEMASCSLQWWLQLSKCLKVHLPGLCSEVTGPNVPISLWITFVHEPALQILSFCTELDTETPLLIYFPWFLIFHVGPYPTRREKLVNSIKQIVPLGSLALLRKRLSTVKCFPLPLLLSKMAAQELDTNSPGAGYKHTILCLLSPIPSWSLEPLPGIYSSNLGLRSHQSFSPGSDEV